MKVFYPKITARIFRPRLPRRCALHLAAGPPLLRLDHLLPRIHSPALALVAPDLCRFPCSHVRGQRRRSLSRAQPGGVRPPHAPARWTECRLARTMAADTVTDPCAVGTPGATVDHRT